MHRPSLAVVALLLATAPSSADPIQWRVSDGGNDHYYEVVAGPMPWGQARSAAESRSWLGAAGHLATITSDGENDFVVGQVLSAVPAGLFHVWIGGTDDVAEGEYRWITGEPFGYTNWKFGQPDNSGDEDYLDYQRHSFNGVGAWGWNDLHGNYPAEYFLVEYPLAPAAVATPEPTTLSLIGVGVLGLLWRGRRERR